MHGGTVLQPQHFTGLGRRIAMTQFNWGSIVRLASKIKTKQTNKKPTKTKTKPKPKLRMSEVMEKF